MGATPLTALAVLCYPDAELPPEVLREILRGGEEKMREARERPRRALGARSGAGFGYAVTGRR
jgi:selenophosphate synthase